MNLLRFHYHRPYFHFPVWLVLVSATVLPQTAPAPPKPAGASGEAPADSACLKCHPAVAAAIHKKAHPAIEMGCTACHADHQADKTAKKSDHYLSAAAPDLCWTCHDAKDQKIAAAHHGQPFEKAACSGCHDPHGSKNAKLIRDAVHPFFAEKQCEQCHKPPQDGKVKLAADNVNDLCYTCHTDLKNRVASAKSHHTLLDSGTCIDCHNPHAGSYAHQLNQSPREVCTGCHEGVIADKKFVHEPAEANCALCHDPHASDHPQHLRAAGNDLCLECHAADAGSRLKPEGAISLFKGQVNLPGMPFKEVKLLPVKPGQTVGHPHITHPVLLPAGKGRVEITCLSCHKPHAAGGSPLLLVTEKPSKSELCLKCHQ